MALPMISKPRVSMKGILLIMFWTALWFANRATIDWYEHAWPWAWDLPVNALFTGLIVTPPAAVMGILCGSQRTGILCGLASTAAFVLYMATM